MKQILNVFLSILLMSVILLVIIGLNKLFDFEYLVIMFMTIVIYKFIICDFKRKFWKIVPRVASARFNFFYGICAGSSCFLNPERNKIQFSTCAMQGKPESNKFWIYVHSSIGRALISKIRGSGFKSWWACEIKLF